jgi:N-acetylglucosamine malate deacetylase 2
MVSTDSRCILFSYAHPDDESFLAAGTICRYRAEGVQVILFTATRGEAGKAGDPPICTPKELPHVRERELHAAAEILGINVLYLHDFPDRELSGVPTDPIREILVEIIRRHRPQVVVTFDLHGANRHPDHVAISRFTSDAIAAAADPRWFPQLGPAHQPGRLAWNSVPRPWEAARHRGLRDQPGVDFVIDTRQWWQQKALALRAHRSQHLGTEKYFLKQEDQELLMGVEVYRQGWGPPLVHAPTSA